MIEGDPTIDRGIPADIVACRRLWLNVLLQACKDAQRKDRAKPSDGDAAARIERERARLWLAGSSLDLELVCDYAGIDGGRVQRWARRCRDDDWSGPEKGW